MARTNRRLCTNLATTKNLLNLVLRRDHSKLVLRWVYYLSEQFVVWSRESSFVSIPVREQQTTSRIVVSDLITRLIGMDPPVLFSQWTVSGKSLITGIEASPSDVVVWWVSARLDRQISFVVEITVDSLTLLAHCLSISDGFHCLWVSEDLSVLSRRDIRRDKMLSHTSTSSYSIIVASVQPIGKLLLMDRNIEMMSNFFFQLL